jgi:hypothetical protein
MRFHRVPDGIGFGIVGFVDCACEEVALVVRISEGFFLFFSSFRFGLTVMRKDEDERKK